MRYFAIICTVLFFGLWAGAQTPVKEKTNTPSGSEGFLQFPREISYQGFLSGGIGPATDGSYTLQFDIYNVSAGGLSLWTETHPGVDVQKGVFSVRLGSITPLPNYFYQATYVEITATGGPGIGAPVVFSPRINLAASPFSLAPWMTSGYNIYYLYGNVGIGTQNPTQRLTINGDNDQFIITSTSNGNSDIDYSSGGDPTWAVGTGWTGSLGGKPSFYWYNNGEAMNLTNSGALTVRTLKATDTVRASQFLYTTPRTGYITSSGFSDGKSLFPNDTLLYTGGGIYNGGTHQGYFEVPLHLPDGATLTSIDVYAYDVDATLAVSVRLYRHTLSTNSFSQTVLQGTGAAFAGGNTSVTVSPGWAIDNSQYSYTVEAVLPASGNLRYYGYRATITYDDPGFANAGSANPGANAAGSTVSSQGPGSDH
ncbi:MAG TPA: hypothetical protein VL633_03460 [Bacteroidota bacterium]|jgi:hypothetical protein|nr:hypothetical protein [Bacteroidota bacterium]